MWSSRLFWKLVLAYSALYVLFAVLYVPVVAHKHRILVTDQVNDRLRSVAVSLRLQLEKALLEKRYDDVPAIVLALARQTQTRLTVFDPDGVLLADSDEDPHKMVDHHDRPELLEAADHGSGEAERQSATLGKRMHYFALPIVRDGQRIGFVRVAADVESIDQRVSELNRNLLLLTLGVGALLVPLSYLVVGRMIQPLSRLNASAKAIAAGDYSHRVPVTSKDELGHLARVFNTMQEQLKRRVHELQENSDRMSTVLSGMAEGVIAVDPSQRVLLANEASISLLEIVTPDVVGRPLLEVVRNRDVKQTVMDALQDGQACTREITMAVGQRRVLQLLAARLPGTPCPGVVMVLHDVTELRRLENLRRDFVANVSHELKTPLAAIKAYAETLRLGAISDPEHNLSFVERIEDQANRLHQLIVDLLQLARVETGKEAFEFGHVWLATSIGNCRSQHAETAAASGIELAVEESAEKLCVWADPSGVQTILDNLLSNAIKYTPRGGRVTLRSTRDGRFATIEVADTGIGIARQDQQRVFERFYRVDRARSRELGGTGLGLAIVKHLAQALGGDIGLTSELGKGSTFRVRLPLAF